MARLDPQERVGTVRSPLRLVPFTRLHYTLAPRASIPPNTTLLTTLVCFTPHRISVQLLLARTRLVVPLSIDSSNPGTTFYHSRKERNSQHHVVLLQKEQQQQQHQPFFVIIKTSSREEQQQQQLRVVVFFPFSRSSTTTSSNNPSTTRERSLLALIHFPSPSPSCSRPSNSHRNPTLYTIPRFPLTRVSNSS